MGFSACVFAQTDTDDTTHYKDMQEVVVTATRSERKLGNVIIPTQTISNRTIQISGSRRMQDILQEQTGLFITSSVGSGGVIQGGSLRSGVQMQGLSPDYVLILIDGEPLMGRSSGVIDLNRLTTGNIKKIELVKGPSSGLYGSEAMGGVINIITETNSRNNISASMRYGRFATTDLNLSGGYRKGKTIFSAFFNRYQTGGYDLKPTEFGNTLDPYTGYTAQVKIVTQLSERARISISTRYYDEQQPTLYPGNGGDNLQGSSAIREFSINPVIHYRFSAKLQSTLRLYFTQFDARDRRFLQSSGALNYNDLFKQQFLKAEHQSEWKINENHTLIAGLGFLHEQLNTNRYAGIRSNNTGYVFVQDEWKPADKWRVIAGARYDKNAAFRSNLSPKLAIQYNASAKAQFNFSYGAGFKAPDNRQLYLNFTNNAAGSYTIYGANEITLAALQQQLQAGILKTIMPRAGELALLKPETSHGINLGMNYTFSKRLTAYLNLFRNDISNLIVVDIIAFKFNNEAVYSYFNVNKAFTQGLETEWKYALQQYWGISAGYQFLLTADKQVLNSIKSGAVYGRDEQSNYPYVLSARQYGGLPNRSRHMANLKLVYDNPVSGWFGSIRGNWRNHWGTYDTDGNGIINRNSEYADGFLMLNLSLGKSWGKNWRTQAGVDNLLNYKDIDNLPNMPGINWHMQLSWNFIHNNK
jgi:outer membrane receptor for ferrienterochelin and colicins